MHEDTAMTPRPRLKTTGRLTHGHSAGGERSREYRAWQQMRQHCTNPYDRAWRKVETAT